jgi:two-component system phosphate regulon sensor histidine kinase PhoR
MGAQGRPWLVVAALAWAGTLALVLSSWLPIVAAGLLLTLAAAVWQWTTELDHEARRARKLAEGAQAEAARLDASYRELASYFRLIDEPVLVCDGRQTVARANEAASHWLEMDREDLIGRPIDEVFTNAEVLSLHARASRGERCRRRVTIAGENGYRVAEVSAVPVPLVAGADDDEGRGVLLALRDVSELARALEVRTDFAANASHELRTPIAALRGAVDTLLGPAASDEAMRTRLLSMLDENVFRLEDLIRDLLDLSRLEALEGSAKLALVPASELVHVLTQNFEAMCERGGVTLRFELDEELENLRTDRNLLTIILRNLIENAIKFRESGDEVLVRGTITEGDTPSAARTCVLEVIDQGQGIPLPMQQRIFERFYQADTSRDGSKIARGTGLGLAIVKHAVRTLGGAIKVRSVWKHGTTMTVELVGAVPAVKAHKRGG